MATQIQSVAGDSPNIVFDVRGLKPLLEKLRSMEPKVARKVIRRALDAGARVLLDAVRAAAPVGSDYNRRGKVHKGGTLKRNLRVRSIRSRKPGRYKRAVTTQAGWYAGDDFYAAFVEFGHRMGRRPKGGKTRTEPDSRRVVPGRHFMENASKANASAAVAAFEAVFRTEFERAVAAPGG